MRESFRAHQKGKQMAKVKLNPILKNAHGHVADIVFRQFPTRTVMSSRPDKVNQPNTPAQQAVKERFRLAAIYGKAVSADAATKAPYGAKSKETGVPAFALMVADFMHAPVIDEVDLSTYTGTGGDVIRIRASDDFEVKGVRVQIREPEGQDID